MTRQVAESNGLRVQWLVGGVERVLASPAFVWSVIGGGVVLRLAQYLSGRSLWLDESWLALNIIDRSFSGLFGALYYHQGAPAGFLLLERLAIDAFGSSEDALRLEPLLAGVASLPLFFLVAKRLLGPAGAGAALLLFAVLDGPIYYSSEAKQYSTDVCLTLAVLAAGLSVADRRLTNRDTTRLAVLGAVAVWFSHAVDWVLAGVGATLIVGAVLARDRSRLSRLLAVGASWVASFGAVYLINIRHLVNNARALGYHFGFQFLPTPTSFHNAITIARSFEEFLRGDLSLRLPAPLALVGGGLGVLGIISLGRRSPLRLSMLCAPAVIAAAASGVANYPWGGRLTLFLIPLAPLLVVAGAKAVASRPSLLAPTLAAVLVAAIAAPSLVAAIRHLGRPQRHEEMAPAVRTLESRFRTGDTIYINHEAQYALTYYALEQHMGHRLELGRARVPAQTAYALRSIPPTLIIGSNAVDVKAMPRRPSVWVLLSHLVRGDPGQFLRKLDHEGRRLLTETHPGVVLALYDLKP